MAWTCPENLCSDYIKCGDLLNAPKWYFCVDQLGQEDMVVTVLNVGHSEVGAKTIQSLKVLSM